MRRGATVERRWVEMTFLTVRLGGLVALVFLVLSPGKAVAFLAVELAVFGFYMGSRSRRTTSACRWSRPRLEARLPAPPGPDEPQHQRRHAGCRSSWAASTTRSSTTCSPRWPGPTCARLQPLVAAYCAAEGVPYTQTTLWQAYRSVIGYLNTVGLRGKDPFLCPAGRATPRLVTVGSPNIWQTRRAVAILEPWSVLRP